jgi:hypothetical protein
MEATDTHKLEMTRPDADGQQKCKFFFTPPSNASEDEILSYITNVLLGEAIDPNANIRYMRLTEGEWKHVRGPPISSSSDWIDETELTAKHTHELQRTTDNGVDQTKDTLEFTPPPNANEDQTYAYIMKYLIFDEINTLYTNFRYMRLPDGKWIHVHGHPILPSSDLIDEKELAPERVAIEIIQSHSERR